MIAVYNLVIDAHVKQIARTCAKNFLAALNKLVMSQADQKISDDIKMETENTRDQPANETNFKLVKQPIFGFLFLGIVNLLCFNYFLQVQFFLTQSYAPHFDLYANIVYGLSNNCGQLFLIFYGSRFAFSQRIYSSCIALSLILIGYPVLAIINPSEAVGMSMGLLLTFGLGSFNAIIQSAAFGLAGICSGKAMEYFCLGQAVCGLIPWPTILALRAIFTAAGLSTTSLDGGQPAAETATVFASLSIAAVFTLLMVPYYKFHLSKTEAVRKAISDLEAMKHSSLVKHRPISAVIKSTLPLALCAWFILYVTFVVFPTQAIKWTPYYTGYPANFYISMMIYVFQTFDVVGRYMPVWGVTLNVRQIKIGSLARALLIPFFFLATSQLSFFANDITRIFLMAALALTNGFVLTWTMIRGPSQVHEDEKDVASYTMSFFLVNGIFCGSMTALAIEKIMAALS